MFGTTLPAILILFTVMTVPAIVTRTASSRYYVRNIVVAVFLTFVVLNTKWAAGAALFLAGALVCGAAALWSRREGLKLLALEPAIATTLILFIIVLKGDAGGLFEGRGLSPSLTHLDGMFYKHDLGIRAHHFGVFTVGGIVGILACRPLKPVLLKKLRRVLELRELRRRRALPEAAVFGDKFFAPWRMIQRSRRRLSARIHRATCHRNDF